MDISKKTSFDHKLYILDENIKCRVNFVRGSHPQDLATEGGHASNSYSKSRVNCSYVTINFRKAESFGKLTAKIALSLIVFQIKKYCYIRFTTFFQ
jgi:hypothetical protein